MATATCVLGGRAPLVNGHIELEVPFNPPQNCSGRSCYLKLTNAVTIDPTAVTTLNTPNNYYVTLDLPQPFSYCCLNKGPDYNYVDVDTITVTGSSTFSWKSSQMSLTVTGGNNTFTCTVNAGTTLTVTVPAGSYTPDTLVTAVNAQLALIDQGTGGNGTVVLSWNDSTFKYTITSTVGGNMILGANAQTFLTSTSFLGITAATYAPGSTVAVGAEVASKTCTMAATTTYAGHQLLAGAIQTAIQVVDPTGRCEYDAINREYSFYAITSDYVAIGTGTPSTFLTQIVQVQPGIYYMFATSETVATPCWTQKGRNSVIGMIATGTNITSLASGYPTYMPPSQMVSGTRILVDVPNGPRNLIVGLYKCYGNMTSELTNFTVMFELTPIDSGFQPDLSI